MNDAEEIFLEKGVTYHLDTSDPSYNPDLGARYVRQETFRDGKKWETFFSYFGGCLLNSSEGLVVMDGILQRIRIPAKGVRVDEKGKVSFEGELVSRLIVEPTTRTKLVTSWLEEVEEIKASDMIISE